VKTELTATFATSPESYATGRADLKDGQSGRLLSIQTFDLGISGGLPVTVHREVIQNATAPSSTGTWGLEVVVYCSVTGTFTEVATNSFNIQIGSQSSQGNLLEMQVLQNGDFENGLSNWQTIGFPGYSSASKLAHSGSGSVELLVYTRPDIGPSVTTIQGVSQTVAVTNLRGLNVEAWFLMKVDGPSDTRLRITIGGFTINYYAVFYDPELATSRDNDTSKSILLNQYAPYGLWQSLNRDVAQDFQSKFGVAGQVPFQSSEATIQISLELITYGTLSGPQYLYWDDVGATASLLAQSSTTSITNSATSSSTVTSTTTSGATILSTYPTQSQTSTQLAPETYFSFEPLLPVLLVAMVIVAGLVAIFLLMRRPRRTSTPSTQTCPKCGLKSPPNSQYCYKCGTKLS
jgi:hypothetical protein